MVKEKQFFEMSSGDKFTLVALLVYAVITFFFVQSGATISKMAVFGWLMGVFMFIAPIISLICMNLDYAKADKIKEKANK
ncbi:MAG: hypothetical protein QME73_11780 [Bacillota bacterium]|nr:hypothetical protein [Bacillota bacterium]